MTTDFTAKNIYEFEAKGTRSTKAAIDKVKKAQQAAAKQALRDYEAQSKGSKNLAQKFEVLTSSIGGTSTAFGKAAEGGKRVAEGFGLMGVGIMGVGFALQALAPAVGGLISDLGDLAAFGTLERWTPLQDRIDETTARMDIASAAAKAWRAELALLTPVEAAGQKAQVAQEQNVARQRALIEAQAALQRAEQYGGSNTLALQLRVTAAKYEAEAAVYRQVEAETKLGDVQERVAKAAEARAHARAKRNGLQATGAGMGLGGLFGAAGGAQAGVGNIMSAGIAATDLASVAGGVAIPGAIPGIGELAAPSVDTESMKLAVSLAVEGSDAFAMWRDSAQDAFAAIADGSLSTGAALKKMFGDALVGMGLKASGLAMTALGEAAYAAVKPGMQPLVPGYLAAAAYNAGKATLMLGLASRLGSSSGGAGAGGGGGGYGSFGSANTGGGGTQIINKTTFVGDGFEGMSGRRRAAKLRDQAGIDDDGSYEG